MTTATIPQDLMDRLTGDGVTSRFLAERMGITRKEALALLVEAGAIRDNSARYYLRGSRPPSKAMGGKACFPSEFQGRPLMDRS